MRTITKKNLLPLALLGLTWLIFFSRTLFFGQVYFLDDLKVIYYPLEHVYANFQQLWQLPIWSPLFGFGHPLLAWGQLGFFTPVHVLLRLLGLHPLVLLQVSILTYFALGLLGMFVFLTRRRLHPLAAALGSIVFVFSGFHVGHLNHVNFYVATMVLPWLLVAIDAFVEKPTLRRASLMAIVAAVIPLSGHAQIVLYTLIIAAITGIILATRRVARLGGPPPSPSSPALRGDAVGRGKRRDRTHRQGRQTFLVKLTSLTTLAGLLALSLASFAILPVFELLPNSDRAEPMLKEELYEFSYPPAHIITLLQPYYFGDHDNYWGAKNFQELAAYVGLVPLLLAGFALTRWRSHRPERGLAVTLIAISLALAPGVHSPIYRYLIDHEIITSLAIPGRFVYFFDVGLALLAALGLSDLIRRLKHQRPASTALAASLVIFSAVTLILYGWNYNPLVSSNFALSPSPLNQILQEYRQQNGLPARLLSRENLLREEASAAQHATEPISPQLSFHQPITVPADNAICLKIPLYAKHQDNTKITVTLREDINGQPIAETTINEKDTDNSRDHSIYFTEFIGSANRQFVISFSADKPSNINLYFQPTDDGAPDRAYLARVANPTPAELQRSRKNIHLIFAWEFTPEADQDAILISRHMQTLASASAVRWISAFSIGPYREFVEAFFANDRTVFDSEGRHFLERNRELLNMSGVTHAIQLLPPGATDQMPATGFTGVADVKIGNSQARLYTNPAAYSKAFLVANEPILPGIVQIPIADATATITNYQSTQVDVAVDTPQDAYLILTDAWTPQWQVLIDGEPAPSLVANTVFRAAFVPAGRHTVTFQYYSPAVERAKQLTLGGLIVISIILVWPRKTSSH